MKPSVEVVIVATSKPIKFDRNSIVMRQAAPVIALFISTALFVSCSILVFTSFQYYHQAQLDSEILAAKLPLSGSEAEPGALNELAQQQSHDVVILVTYKDQVTLANTTPLADHYFIDEQAQDKLSLTKLISGPGETYFYHYDQLTDRGAIDIYTDFTVQIEMVKSLFKILLFVFVLWIIIGGVTIFWISSKTSRTLKKMVGEIHNNQSPELHVIAAITRPEKPTELHELATAYNDLAKQINHLIEQQNQFLQNASHELKTPIFAIQGHVNLILRHQNDHPEVIAPSLQDIDHETTRLQQLVGNLLTMARVDGHHKPEIFDFSELITDIAAASQKFIPQTIRLELDPSLKFHGEKAAFQMILEELIRNASKYAPPLSTITIRAHQAETTLTLSVMDQGRGIATAYREKVFERFYRLNPGEREGSGLGLAMVHQVVQHYGGQISIQTAPPHGCLIVITLKMKRI